jgi:hypothetical protein
MIPPDKVEAFWREAAAERAERERSYLEDKIGPWTREVANVCHDIAGLAWKSYEFCILFSDFHLVLVKSMPCGTAQKLYKILYILMHSILCLWLHNNKYFTQCRLRHSVKENIRRPLVSSSRHPDWRSRMETGNLGLPKLSGLSG